MLNFEKYKNLLKLHAERARLDQLGEADMSDTYEYRKSEDTEFSFKFGQYREGQSIADRGYVVDIKPRDDGSVYVNVWETRDGVSLLEGTFNKHRRYKDEDPHTFNSFAEIEAFARQVLKFAVECKYNIKDYAGALV